MLVRGLKQLLLVFVPAAILLLLFASIWQKDIVTIPSASDVWPPSNRWSDQPATDAGVDTFPEQVPEFAEEKSSVPDANEDSKHKSPTEIGSGVDVETDRILTEKFLAEIAKSKEDAKERERERILSTGGTLPVDSGSGADKDSPKQPFDVSKSHREIFSVSTKNKKYFLIDYGDYKAYNANLIPHPHLNDTWLVISQQQAGNPWPTVWFAELVCDGYFEDDTMVCRKSPLLLTIANTFTDKCNGELAYFGFNNGPHDARVFYGPDEPYTMFGSNSRFTCFGLFMQDLRTLVDWGMEFFDKDKFRHATELQKPTGHTWRPVEKNWFMFWDSKGDLYTHHDLSPKRVFSKTSKDGKQGPDLAPLVAEHDNKCLDALMPPVAITLESIHQATNSLSITTCKRSDPSCVPGPSNTFIMSIFHWKSFYDFHGVYEPYVVLFKQDAPFELHGISSIPLWISGRGKPGERTGTPKDDTRPKDQTEMVYVTSITWKQKGLKYHGYADDVMFLGFGLEDSKPAAIDVLAGDLLQDIALCSSVQ